MLQYTFMQNALIASFFISILCPCVGVFLVLKKHSMIGDALAHSSLAGVALGLLLGYDPIISALIFTTICAIFMETLRNFYKKYSDLMLVIILTLSVGIAITLISSGKIHTNVNSFLFGSILTVSRQDLYTVFFLSLFSVILLFTLYHKLLYITFDEEGAKVSGINIKIINYLFAILVGCTISISIRIIGMMVISSMIAIPVATALQLKKDFKRTLLFSILFGAIDMLAGVIISYYYNCAPGGSIALVSVIVLISIIFFIEIRK